MSYLLGTAADENDFLSQLVTWLAGLGWTVNMAPTVSGDAGGMRAHISKGAMYVNLQAGVGDSNLGAWGIFRGILLYMGDGFDGTPGNTYLAQPGGPMDSGGYRAMVLFSTKNFALPFGRFFAFSDALGNVVVVLERRSLNFVHLGWGPGFKKAGAYADGRYFFSEYYGNLFGQDDTGGAGLGADCPFVIQSAAAAFVRADVDSFVGEWLACAQTHSGGTGWVGKSCFAGITYGVGAIPADVPQWQQGQGFQRLRPSTLNSQAVLVPVDVYTPRDAGGSSLLGSVPNIFLSNAVGHGFSGGTEYDIGADAYLIFPGANATGFGYAIKKN